MCRVMDVFTWKAAKLDLEKLESYLAIVDWRKFFLTFFLSVLDVHAFERLLGPCMDILKRNIDGYEEQLDKLGISHAELRWNLLCWNFHLESVHRWPIFQQKILRFSKICGYHFPVVKFTVAVVLICNITF